MWTLRCISDGGLETWFYGLVISKISVSRLKGNLPKKARTWISVSDLKVSERVVSIRRPRPYNTDHIWILTFSPLVTLPRWHWCPSYTPGKCLHPSALFWLFAAGGTVEHLLISFGKVIPWSWKVTKWQSLHKNISYLSHIAFFSGRPVYVVPGLPVCLVRLLLTIDIRGMSMF